MPFACRCSDSRWRFCWARSRTGFCAVAVGLEQEIVALAGMMVVLLACVRISFGIFSPILSSKDLGAGNSRAVPAGRSDRRDRAIRKCVHAEFLHRNSVTQSCAHRAETCGTAPSFPEHRESSRRRLRLSKCGTGPHRVFLWAEEEDPPALHGLTSYVVARRGGKIIFSNQPPVTHASA